MATEIPTGNLTRDVQDTISNARDGIRTAIDRGSEKAAHFKDAAVEKATRYKDVAFERGRSMINTVETTIDERPLLVLGGVFLGGLLLGMLLTRK